MTVTTGNLSSSVSCADRTVSQSVTYTQVNDTARTYEPGALFVQDGMNGERNFRSETYTVERCTHKWQHERPGIFFFLAMDFLCVF